MQQTPPSSLTGLEYAVISIAVTLAGGIGAFLTWIINRRKLKPEISVIDATAEKTRAEARKLDGDTIHLAWQRIDELFAISENQRSQIRQLSMDNDKKTGQVEVLEAELVWMKSVISVAGVDLGKYHDLRQKHSDKGDTP